MYCFAVESAEVFFHRKLILKTLKVSDQRFNVIIYPWTFMYTYGPKNTRFLHIFLAAKYSTKNHFVVCLSYVSLLLKKSQNIFCIYYTYRRANGIYI